MLPIHLRPASIAPAWPLANLQALDRLPHPIVNDLWLIVRWCVVAALLLVWGAVPAH